MVIDEKVAQIILDAITWELHSWTYPEMDSNIISGEIVAQGKRDFVDFCKAYGIETIERRA